MNHIPAFAFPAKDDTYLPTPEGWKAELALGGWLHTKINVQDRELNPNIIVTHLSTNQAWHSLTSLVQTNMLLRQTATS